MSKRKEQKVAFLNEAYKITGGRREITRPEVVAAAAAAGVKSPAWLTNDPIYRVKWGVYRLPTLAEVQGRPSRVPKTVAAAVASVAVTATAAASPVAAEVAEVKSDDAAYIDFAMIGGDTLVPAPDATYVAWGNHDKVYRIVKSGQFHPVYITGDSGCGKTFMVEQICAALGREFYRVNITAETSEDDLLGGFRLVNGETKFHYGPVALAMVRGGVLLLDEVDLGTNKILCLQPVMEGKAVYLKKINKWVAPAKGFTVLLTGNTKGLGDLTGKFIGTAPMNNAFLERINVTLEQDYPSASIERKMLVRLMNSIGKVDEGFADVLTRWAENTRKIAKEGGSDDLITTRRLTQIVKNWLIYDDRLEAVEDAVARFDEVTREAFVSGYKALDPVVNPSSAKADKMGEAPAAASTDPNDCPF
jgi:MoxR-like ATPase